MIEAEIVTCLNRINIGTDLQYLVDGQNGVHPMDKTFGLVGKIDEYDMGTSTQTLTSRTGKYYSTQSKGYDIRISIQGRKARNVRGEGIDDFCERLKLLMDVPTVRQLFMDIGYTYKIDPQILPIPIQLNTDQYVRYSFKVSFFTSITTEFELGSILKAEVHGDFYDSGNNLISEYDDDIG